MHDGSSLHKLGVPGRDRQLGSRENECLVQLTTDTAQYSGALHHRGSTVSPLRVYLMSRRRVPEV